MKILKYKFCNKVNYGTEEEPNIVETFSDVEMGWNETNEEIAKKEAYNGEYVIEDDGQPDPTTEPTQLDRLEAQIAYLAMVTDNAEILEV